MTNAIAGEAVQDRHSQISSGEPESIFPEDHDPNFLIKNHQEKSFAHKLIDVASVAVGVMVTRTFIKGAKEFKNRLDNYGQ